MTASAKINLLDFNRTALEAFFVAHDEKPYRAKHLMRWLHQRGVSDFAQMTDMSKPLREILATNCSVELPRILSAQHSSDGTRKWLLAIDDQDNAV